MIAPLLADVGYTLRGPASWDYTFVCENDSSRNSITFDHDKYLKSKVRVHFMMTPKSNGLSVWFYLSYLNPDFFPPIHEEDEGEYLRRLTEQIISIVIPYMDLQAQNKIHITDDMYVELAKNTQERADRFAMKYNLSPVFETKGAKIDEIMWSLQSDIQHRSEDFYANLQEILDMAAYAGECMNLKNIVPSSGQWFWNDRGCYCIRAMGYDILNRVAEAWTAGKEIRNYSLKGLF